VTRVLLLLCKGVEIYEAAAFFDVLGWSKEYGADSVEVVTVGLQEEVRGTFGIRLRPDVLLADAVVDEYDALAIPGGFGTHGYYEEAYSEPVSELIRSFVAADKPVASICVGALPIAKSGVLTGRSATTYHLRDGIRRRELAQFDVNVVDQSLVWDGDILTSTSPATAMDAAFALLARLTSDANAADIREMMGF
jgi:protein deglycase